jgi:hypothetical protein
VFPINTVVLQDLDRWTQLLSRFDIDVEEDEINYVDIVKKNNENLHGSHVDLILSWCCWYRYIYIYIYIYIYNNILNP